MKLRPDYMPVSDDDIGMFWNLRGRYSVPFIAQYAETTKYTIQRLYVSSVRPKSIKITVYNKLLHLYKSHITQQGVSIKRGKYEQILALTMEALLAKYGIDGLAEKLGENRDKIKSMYRAKSFWVTHALYKKINKLSEAKDE